MPPGAVPLPDPSPRPVGPRAAVEDVALDGVSVRVVDIGLACCMLEVVAASTAALGRPAGPAGEGRAGADARDPASKPGAPGAAAPHLNVLVVAGTVTDVLAPHVLRAYDELPEPRRVVSFGSCSNSGGPYWDSYSVTKGIGQLLPVDVWVPGCPPRPEALADALRELA